MSSDPLIFHSFKKDLVRSRSFFQSFTKDSDTALTPILNPFNILKKQISFETQCEKCNFNSFWCFMLARKGSGENIKNFPLRNEIFHSKGKLANPSVRSKIKGILDLLDPFSDPYTSLVVPYSLWDWQNIYMVTHLQNWGFCPKGTRIQLVLTLNFLGFSTSLKFCP